MAYNPSHRWRAAAGRLGSGAALVMAGATLVLALQMGWWATLCGAALVTAWIIAVDCWSVLRAAAPIGSAASRVADAEATSLRSLLDQVPVPLIRLDTTGARAINRAARSLFDTDDRILPSPPALLDPATDRLGHEGRRWRISAVNTAPGQRLLVLIDVEAEERAAEGRASDEMIDILGHELLNGLSPIVSLADSAVTAAARGDVVLPDILATLARRAESLEGFTRAYRTLSRLPDPVPAPVSLGDLADDLARLFASRFGASVALAHHVPLDAVACVDRDQVTQALWALLQNGAEAALAAPSPCQVDLSMACGAGHLTVRVCDTGPGIKASNRVRIFRPFFTTKPHGSGIGLSLARRIARAHGGDLTLLALSATTFELRLPAS